MIEHYNRTVNIQTVVSAIFCVSIGNINGNNFKESGQLLKILGKVSKEKFAEL